MKSKSAMYMALALLVIVTLACGSSNQGKKVAETGGKEETAAPPKVEIYKVGDVVQVNDHTIVLNSVDAQSGILKANFTIDNKGSSDLNVSSLLAFSAKGDDGSKLELEIMNCGSSRLDGKVLPSDKLKGDICWKGLTTPTAKIYYQSSLFGSGAIVWEFKK